MEDLKFTQAVSRLRVLEKRLLDKSKIERMIDSASADEVLRILSETEYANLMSDVKRAEDYELLLSKELKRVYSLIYEISPDKTIIDIMSLRNDYHNIKVLLKGKALDKDLDYLLMPDGNMDVNELKSAIQSGDLRDLNPMAKMAIEEVNKIFADTKDPQQIDIIVDRYMFAHMLDMAKTTKMDFLIDYVKITIDFTNIKTLIRVKKQQKDVKFLREVLIDGGTISLDKFTISLNDSLENFMSKIRATKYFDIIKVGIEEYISTNKLTALEKICDNYIMDYIKKAKYITFGAEPLIAYVLAKETEIKIIRIIMVGKLNNIAPEVIRERVRDVYV
ncbi:V/A-type H+-transporting ATPase subunit C [Clostridium collagenovorans DSM 3089]|uniref:V/A-type H+-transporting ATPase subunit C n=1 Tax=Clostridium collagenovorans DSM 3089 TaxID=1121306 RepID=A0A1M5TYN7_9CLOT|nr:V-type ATP synthase subunit C [Clostridium collagenovorans]SHH55897.1 V/A-type H+-transporting ATPase subunit C [Clostridium collagenovorans DSM 3089]